MTVFFTGYLNVLSIFQVDFFHAKTYMVNSEYAHYLK